MFEKMSYKMKSFPYKLQMFKQEQEIVKYQRIKKTYCNRRQMT